MSNRQFDSISGPTTKGTPTWAIDDDGNARFVGDVKVGRLTGDVTHASLTAGRVVFVGAGGILADKSTFTFDSSANTLTVNGTVIGFSVASSAGGLTIGTFSNVGAIWPTGVTPTATNYGFEVDTVNANINVPDASSSRFIFFNQVGTEFARFNNTGLLPANDAALSLGSSSRRFTDVWARRFMGAQGADVNSANTLTVSTSDTTSILGTTQINLITTTGYTVGNSIQLRLNGALTIAHNQTAAGLTAGILMASAGNYTGRANSLVTLVLCSNGALPVWVMMGD